MGKSLRSRRSIFAYLFWLTLALTILIYVLRGLGILTFIPGGILLILIAAVLTFGLFYGIDKTRRF